VAASFCGVVGDDGAEYSWVDEKDIVGLVCSDVAYSAADIFYFFAEGVAD
jgi:hypothetical protein